MPSWGSRGGAGAGRGGLDAAPLRRIRPSCSVPSPSVARGRPTLPGSAVLDGGQGMPGVLARGTAEGLEGVGVAGGGRGSTAGGARGRRGARHGGAPRSVLLCVCPSPGAGFRY